MSEIKNKSTPAPAAVPQQQLKQNKPISFLSNGMMLHFTIDQQLVYIMKKLDRNKSNWKRDPKPNIFYSPKEMEKKQKEQEKELEELKKILVDNRPYQESDKVIKVNKKISYEKMINEKKHLNDYKKIRQQEAFVPAEIHVGLLRDQITMSNLSNFYAGTVINFKGTSEEFISNYLRAFKTSRITKVKGELPLEDVLIKKWLIYDDIPYNQTIFKLAPQ